MAKKSAAKDRARLHALIEEATVDCYGESEQHLGLVTMVEENVACPCTAKVIGEEVEMRVADEGVGIPDDLRERVFDLFVQADGDGPQRRFGGLGLGLYITRAIVEGHGGSVVAEPNREAGSGTVLVVRLPVTARLRRLGPEPPAAGEPPSFVVRRS